MAVFKIMPSFLMFASLAYGAAPDTSKSLAIPSMMPHSTSNRSIYLNGVDISSVKNHELKSVQSIRINEKGDIYITDPHYTVVEEETYAPLSSKAHPPHIPLQTTDEGAKAKADQPAKAVEQPLTAKAPDAPVAKPEGMVPQAPAEALPKPK